MIQPYGEDPPLYMSQLLLVSVIDVGQAMYLSLLRNYVMYYATNALEITQDEH